MFGLLRKAVNPRLADGSFWDVASITLRKARPLGYRQIAHPEKKATRLPTIDTHSNPLWNNAQRWVTLEPLRELGSAGWIVRRLGGGW
jgi:hypothetical protein